MRATFDDPSLAGLGEDPSDILSDRHPYLQFNNAHPSPRPGKGAKRERGARFANIAPRKQRTSRLTPGGLPQPPEVAGVEADARVPNVLQLMSGEEFNNHEIAGGLPQFHSPLQSPPTGTASTDTMPKGQLQAQGGGKPKNMAAGDRSTFGKPLGMPTDQGQPSPLAGLPHFAEGGDLPAGQTGVVGEQGEEEITATPGGGVQVTPLEQPAAQQPVTASPQLGTVADAIQHAAVAPRPPRDAAIAPQAATPAPAPAKAPAPVPSTQSTGISTPAPAAPAPAPSDGLSPEGKQAMADIVNSYPTLAKGQPNPLDPALQPHGVHRALDVLAGLGTGILSLNPLAGMGVYHALQDQAAERNGAAQPGYVSPQTQANIEAANKSIEPALTSATQIATQSGREQSAQEVADIRAREQQNAWLARVNQAAAAQGQAIRITGYNDDGTPQFEITKLPDSAQPIPKGKTAVPVAGSANGKATSAVYVPGKGWTDPYSRDVVKNFVPGPQKNESIADRIVSSVVGPQPTTPEYNGRAYPSIEDAQKAWGIDANAARNSGSFGEQYQKIILARTMLQMGYQDNPQLLGAATQLISGLNLGLSPESVAQLQNIPADWPRDINGVPIGTLNPAFAKGPTAERLRFAREIIPTVNQLTLALKANPNAVGPLHGRVNDIITGHLGAPGSKYYAADTALHNVATAWMRMHANSDTARQEFVDLLNTAQASGNLVAALNVIHDQLNIYATYGAPPNIGSAYKEFLNTSGTTTPSELVPNPVNPPPGGQTSFTVTAPDGKVFKFKDQASADKFKKDAGIQ